jgi:hypothetical protein
MLIVAVLNSCGSKVAVLDLRTRDGAMVRDLVAEERTAILIYAASTCFGCGTPLAYWEELARSGRLRLLVLISGEVTEADLRNLRIQRIPAVAISEQDAKRASSVPSEYVVIGGRIEERAEGAGEVRERRLWKLVEADSLRFPKTQRGGSLGTADP